MPEAMQAIDRIVDYADRQAPLLLSRVKGLIIQFVRYSQSARSLLPQIDRQIELEKSGALQFALDNRPITIPAPFLKCYKDLFPDVYRRVHVNLTDKKNVTACVMEIFVEFLVQEREFGGLAAHHRDLLEEITDRTCARMNGVGFEEFLPKPVPREAGAIVWGRKLHEEVLKGIEQELIKLVQEPGGAGREVRLA
jgi:hypothetical protein